MGLVEIAAVIGALSTLLVSIQGLVSVIQGFRREHPPERPDPPPAASPGPTLADPMELARTPADRPTKRSGLDRLSYLDRGEIRRMVTKNGKGKRK